MSSQPTTGQEPNGTSDADLAARLNRLEEQIASLRRKVDASEVQDKVSIILFSGEMDRVIAALNIATGSAAMGMDVHLFFTFWGTPVLRKSGGQVGQKEWLQKLFAWMLPKGPNKLPLSKINFGGMGPVMLKRLMKKLNTPSVPALIELAQECGVHFHVCQMSMELMGMDKDELMDIEGLGFCGVAGFLDIADKSKHTLFI